ncbi:transposase [Candidatus Poribacteria bacterium]|nr:transposase [Candidatus Poribacteria bacterium]
MSQLHIEDIRISYQGQDLSQYGLFPLFAWYLMDVIKLPDYFEPVTVNKPRNENRLRKPKKRVFSDAQMCMGLVSLPILGIGRLGKITERLSNEIELAKLLSLPHFFEQSTAHGYLNRFTKWHVTPLDQINHQLIKRYGTSAQQPVVIVDIDSQTHTLESRQRQKAVVGFNKKKPGKPCYQWNVAFVCNEAVSQRLMAGNSHCRQSVLFLMDDVAEKLSRPLMIVRKDCGSLSGDVLSALVERQLQICMACRYDWVLAQGIQLKPEKWVPIDEITRLYDVGKTPVISTCQTPFRVVLVEKEQTPFPGSKSRKRFYRYGILENLAFNLKPEGVLEFYHGRQTIEPFFKESTGPFQAGQMPSQKFRANEAYLQWVTIAQNCCLWFKKNFCLPFGTPIQWKPCETSSSIMAHQSGLSIKAAV